MLTLGVSLSSLINKVFSFERQKYKEISLVAEVGNAGQALKTTVAY